MCNGYSIGPKEISCGRGQKTADLLLVLLASTYVANHYRSDINRENPLGCEGQLAYSFAALVKKLWNGDNEYLYPKNLKVCACVRVHVVYVRIYTCLHYLSTCIVYTVTLW